MSPRLSLALLAVAEAGARTLRWFLDDELEVEWKDDATPVTRADREAEQCLRDLIGEAFPDDAIEGEEFPEKAGTGAYRWILDPIDGTKSFVHGVPLYGVLVGVERNGVPEIGVIHLPALDETVWAEVGKGAWWRRRGREPVRARVSEVGSLPDALFCTTSIGTFRRAGRPEVHERLSRASGLSRGWGDCYGYVLVATGRAEIMVDPLLSPWDAGPLIPILEEAGGAFTDWEGNRTIRGGNGVATNGRLRETALAFTSGRPTR